MIEIIILIFLTKTMGQLAERKGLPSGKWKLITVLSWIAFEMIGLILGIAFFGTGNLYALMAFGLVCAFGGFLTVKYILENKQGSKMDDDIERIGRDRSNL